MLIAALFPMLGTSYASEEEDAQKEELPYEEIIQEIKAFREVYRLERLELFESMDNKMFPMELKNMGKESSYQ